jgi:hypothetical protein
MLVTSAAIPPAACGHRLAGRLRWRAIDAPAVPSRLGRHGRTAASRR